MVKGCPDDHSEVHLYIRFPGFLRAASAEEEGGVTAALREHDPPTPVEPGGVEPITVPLDPTAL